MKGAKNNHYGDGDCEVANNDRVFQEELYSKKVGVEEDRREFKRIRKDLLEEQVEMKKKKKMQIDSD